MQEAKKEKREPTEPSESLMARIRAATAPAHEALDTSPYFQALTEGRLPLESYVGQLRALSVIHSTLEESLTRGADPRIASVWRDDMRKLPLLHLDLRFFEPRLVADLKEAVVAAVSIDTEIRLRALEQPLSLLGFLYVLEGSTLGAQVLRPLFARNFQLEDKGLAYITNYGPQVRPRFTGFAARMDALKLTAPESSQIVAAAVNCFERIEEVFSALYPFTPEARTFLATSINPEAGRHAVPEDPREIEASIRAGDLCFKRFPYCEQRFGERGRRFSRSDAAWKATLCQYAPDQILEQVRWLGRVLAARGLPSVMLQVTLELLVSELIAAVPEREDQYSKLLPAAHDLLTMRRKYLSDDQVQVLASDFDRTADTEWAARLPLTALLIASAVADELHGCEGAVTSLRPWLVDPERFPANWIAAVEATFINAREFARLNTSEAGS